MEGSGVVLASLGPRPPSKQVKVKLCHHLKQIQPVSAAQLIPLLFPLPPLSTFNLLSNPSSHTHIPWFSSSSTISPASHCPSDFLSRLNRSSQPPLTQKCRPFTTTLTTPRQSFQHTPTWRHSMVIALLIHLVRLPSGMVSS